MLPHDIDGILKRRGILASATRLGLERQGQAWRYPVRDGDGSIIGYRFKHSQKEHKPKYWWEGGKPDHAYADWYIFPEARAAIVAADGLCYLANGEPALWAFHAAGIENVIATTLSEISVPDNLLEIVAALGITRLVNIADSDPAGKQAAVNWRDALLNSDVTYKAYQWPERLGDKADANDLWIDVQFDAPRFSRAINLCNPLLLPEPRAKKPAAAPATDITEPLARAIHDALEREGRFNGKRSKGMLMHHCVHHEDEHPSAGFNPETGVINCFVCGPHSPYETAEKLGINWRQFYPQRPQKSSTPDLSAAQRRDMEVRLQGLYETEIEDSKTQWETAEKQQWAGQICQYLEGDYRSWWNSEHVPLYILSAIMNLTNTRSSTALVLAQLHTLFRSGKLNWAAFTVEDVVSNTRFDQKVVRKALQELLELSFWAFPRTESLFNILSSIDKKVLSSETGRKYLETISTYGRPPQYYTLSFDMERIHTCLYQRLEICLTESIHKKSLAKWDRRFIEDMGIEDVTTFQKLKSISEAGQQHDVLSKEDAARLRKELGGDNHWAGWKAALRSNTILSVDVMACEGIRDLRAQLLIQWISTVRNENTREDLCRVIGCSDATLQSIYSDYDIGSIQQHEKVELAANFQDLRPVMREYQRDNRAIIWQVRFKKRYEKGWQTVAVERAGYEYAKDRANGKHITRVFMMMIKPSRQYVITPAFRMWRSHFMRGLLAYLMHQHGSHLVKEPQTAYEVPPQPAKESRPVAATSRKWLHHDGRFQYEQIRLAVFMFTPHEVVDNTIVDKQNAVLHTARRLPDFAAWLVEHAAPKPIRSSAEYRGIELVDYSEATNELLKAAYNDEMRELYDELVPEFDMPEQMPLTEEVPPAVPVVNDERMERFIEFWNERYEREKSKRGESPFAFIRDLERKWSEEDNQQQSKAA